MAEFVNVPVQTIQENQNALFSGETSCCNKGLVLHRTGSGQFTVRGCTQNCRAKYRVIFSGNIAVAGQLARYLLQLQSTARQTYPQMQS